MTDKRRIQDFYDAFSNQLVRDYLIPNRRIIAQMDFLRDSIPRNARRVLVIGCGTGQVAQYITRRIARHAHVLGVDISSQSIAIADALFSGRRLSFRRVDVTDDSIEGRWDVIVLPDVYEHIPVGKRERHHARLKRWLHDSGRLVLTLPSPGHQDLLGRRGTGLQIVDETVTLADLQKLADDLNAAITYFAMISAFGTNDYIHAVIERGSERVVPITRFDRLPIKRKRGWLATCRRFAVGPSGLLYYPWRRLRLWRIRKWLTHDESGRSDPIDLSRKEDPL